MMITHWLAHIIVWLAGRLTKGTQAVTIGKWIFIWPPECVEDDMLIQHEHVHLKQWKRLGWFLFPIVYVWQFVRYGYASMPIEKEANRD